MNEFCTLFDRQYLARGLALYRSLERHGGEFRLRALCLDEDSERLLGRIDADRLEIIPIAELESHDPQLRAAREDRSPVEYYWTATPSLPLYIFGTRPVDEITYLDADLMFFSDPEALFREMGDDSVLITPHRFAPELAHHAINGIYNVQFMTFRRDDRGLEALNWWHDRCIEWCYYRLEDGKLGDQKYLDDWPERFEAIHVLRHKGGGLAPWNITQYDVHAESDGVYVDDDPLVFFHYHRLRLLEQGSFMWRPAGYHISAENRRLVYDPYIAELSEAIAQVSRVEPGFSAGFEPEPSLRERFQLALQNLAAWFLWKTPWLMRYRHRRDRLSGEPSVSS